MNCDEYQSMILGHGDTDRIINSSIESEHIQQSRSIKILAVNIDEKINFRLNISQVCNRVSNLFLASSTWLTSYKLECIFIVAPPPGMTE